MRIRAILLQVLLLIPHVHAGETSLKPRSILDLQSFKATQSLAVSTTESIDLIDLNPNIGIWFLVKLTNSSEETYLNIEMPSPSKLKLVEDGVEIVDGEASAVHCTLWQTNPLRFEKENQDAGSAYRSFCSQRLYLREEAKGSESATGQISNFLKNYSLTAWIPAAYKSLFAAKPEILNPSRNDIENSSARAGIFSRANVDEKYLNSAISISETSIDIPLETEDSAILLGAWYRVKNLDGIRVSVITDSAIHSSIRNYDLDKIWIKEPENPKLVEATESLVYLADFDLAKFEVGYQVGVEQPCPKWAGPPPSVGIPAPLKSFNVNVGGPDGVNSKNPLVTNGTVPPYLQSRTVSAFNAGFRREDMFIEFGPLSKVNFASHWGFIENGVVFSKLQPGLATLLIFADGQVEMKTWQESDNVLLPKIKHARQNGVPLIDGYDEKKKIGIPSPYLTKSTFKFGNWNGGAAGYMGGQTWWDNPNVFRQGSALCLKKENGSNHLIFGYFRDSNPGIMVQVLQSYGCRYAMQLDINLERSGHLSFLSQTENGKVELAGFLHKVGRFNDIGSGDRKTINFINRNDNRDFFYILKK